LTELGAELAESELWSWRAKVPMFYEITGNKEKARSRNVLNSRWRELP